MSWQQFYPISGEVLYSYTCEGNYIRLNSRVYPQTTNSKGELLYSGRSVYSVTDLSASALNDPDAILVYAPITYEPVAIIRSGIVQDYIPFNLGFGYSYVYENDNINLIYYGKIIYTSTTGNIVRRSANSIEWCAITTGTTTTSLFYKGSLIYTSPYIPPITGVYLPLGDYFILAGNGIGNVYYLGELIYSGPITGVFFDDATPYCRFQVDSYTELGSTIDIGMLWYKGELVYNGVLYWGAATDVPCGELFQLIVNLNAYKIFNKGAVVEENDSLLKLYKCCSGLLYFVNDDQTIDVWNEQYGKMKFNTDTLERLA